MFVDHEGTKQCHGNHREGNKQADGNQQTKEGNGAITRSPSPAVSGHQSLPITYVVYCLMVIAGILSDGYCSFHFDFVNKM